ncbi:phosphopantetheine-binding protein [Bacillus cereus]|uniref:phosphopantetheine-binding protein n=1 Tax=Bacillus TaxID=1386 RepID=UPI000BF9E7B9|nr:MULTISPECIES: phosphopantetheine-binding protein [Bacillus]MDF9507621.1 phosphopantetheine-binding protein [Bacillus cereus]MDF9596654.1 phosphopantetheine-binding protein [Bacillus cereus]MDF9609763.1 phosphopantetheine-binding protein [Bacillus cereus]MDF9659978.1 phosphopantetheine-binding protein [Bacillus cereus]PFX72057.1 acyl carrier protein [Bacillus cereus]
MEFSKEEFVKVLERFIDVDVEKNWEVELSDLGLDSMVSIELLLEIEEWCDITFPDELLTAETFLSAKSLWDSLYFLLGNEVS